MEFLAALVGITHVSVRAGSKLLALRDAWRTAPAALHRLCDDLARAEHFFGEMHDALQDSFAAALAAEAGPPPSQSDQELRNLLDEGAKVIKEIEDIVDRLQRGGDGSGTAQF